MGTFYVSIGVGHPEGGDLTEVSAMVDTGATHTMLPESLLEQLHIQPLVQRRFGIADSNKRLWGVGQARIAYQDEEWTCPIIFGPEGLYLLGATTLEAFGLVVDPSDKELVPAEHVARPF